MLCTVHNAVTLATHGTYSVYASLAGRRRAPRERTGGGFVGSAAALGRGGRSGVAGLRCQGGVRAGAFAGTTCERGCSREMFYAEPVVAFPDQ